MIKRDFKIGEFVKTKKCFKTETYSFDPAEGVITQIGSDYYAVEIYKCSNSKINERIRRHDWYYDKYRICKIKGRPSWLRNYKLKKLRE